MKQEAEHFHADGDEEEDERVPPLIRDQQLGEDARQGDDYSSCTWEGRGEHTRQEKMEKVRKRVKEIIKIAGIKMCVCDCTHSLRSSPPVCTSWAASPCNHRNWTAALRRDEEVVISINSSLTVNTVTRQFIYFLNLRTPLGKSQSDLL